jgi:hypothetical protein
VVRFSKLDRLPAAAIAHLFVRRLRTNAQKIMKISPDKAPRLLLIAAALWLSAVNHTATADTVYLSNLDTLWTSVGIGDIHGLFPGGPPYGTDTARFTTGSGGGFSLNAITLEFDAVPPSPQWENISIQIFQQAGNLLLGSFGNPVVNPKPTQWPGYTTFIDFSPLESLYLNPVTQYSLVLSVPANSPSGAALLFARSPVYATPTDWIMSSTISGNPYATGEFLKLAVEATLIPEPSPVGLWSAGGILAWVWCRRKDKSYTSST